VQSSVSYTLGNNLEALVLTGQAAHGGGNGRDNQITGNSSRNQLRGEAGNDLLNGGNNKDSLIGGAGNDRLIGGSGQDSLVGNQGQDIFVLTVARANSRDTIRDFSSKDDTIQISRSGFSRNLKLGKLRAEQFQLGSAAQTGSDRFIYNRGAGTLFFDADGVGGTTQVQIARLSNKATLTASDIVVVNS
jgi:Ca2+-binding RTX toxin-like protein